ncbi:BREX-1 system adenine-specific DNA-methyltransferase PglX [Endozoicomonas acroporae]|uniref:BREX-1 system adenine-specific DNA-methyltransferase PglX n=1 Tax=Endozoicomonas acroporae TaxID=1701104 RepID=UPI003D78D408
MNRTQLKNYAPAARRDFITAITSRARTFGITKENIAEAKVQGDVLMIEGRPFPVALASLRKKLVARISLEGFDQVIQAMAYTWFNRFVAIRYMELHGYLDHGYRVLSHPQGQGTPEILLQASHVDLPGLNKEQVIDWQLDGNKDAELYRMLLIAQCNALHQAMPFLFERIDDETELLLPDNLLHSDSVIRKLVNSIDEASWNEIEIIGWLYQFYISERKDQVMGKVVATADIPAATQLFTPNWIVKYLVQNSIGAQWLATYPDSDLKLGMEYYIEPAEQTEEVKQQLAAITPDELNPEALTLIDPACGSGHILVEAYDLFKAIYQERGYPRHKIPQLILKKNLFGLDIDTRAAQMAGFALLMKARADSPRILSAAPALNVHALHDMSAERANEYSAIFLDAYLSQHQTSPQGLFSAKLPLTDAQKETAIAYLDAMVAAIPKRLPSSWKGRNPGDRIKQKMADLEEQLEVLQGIGRRFNYLRYSSSTDVFAYLFDRIDVSVCPPEMLVQWCHDLAASKEKLPGNNLDGHWTDVEVHIERLLEGAEHFHKLIAELGKISEELALGNRYYQFMKLFEQGCTFGSLIQVPEPVAAFLPQLADHLHTFAEAANDVARKCAQEVIETCLLPAQLLATQYDAVVANPPYMGGSKGMNEPLKRYVQKNYNNAKADLFACFVDRGFIFARPDGHNAMVTMQSWMFLSRFEEFRQSVISEKGISSLIQIGYNSFPELNSKIALASAFSIKNAQFSGFIGNYIDLNSAPQSADKGKVFATKEKRFDYVVSQTKFKKITGSPVAYWVSDYLREIFADSADLETVAPVRQGFQTGDNDRFLRLWHEINKCSFVYNAESKEIVWKMCGKWVPYNKGGEYRRWYGNNDFVVSFDEENYKILSKMGNCLPSKKLYFKQAITWSALTSSHFGARFSPMGFTFSAKGACAFPSEDQDFAGVCALLNSVVASKCLKILAPTLDFNVGDIRLIPYKIGSSILNVLKANFDELLHFARSDWDSYEESWDFQISPLITQDCRLPTVQENYTHWQTQNQQAITEMKSLEEDNNRLFIDAYGLQDELTPDVPIEQITLTVNPPYRYGAGKTEAEYETLFRTDTMKELVSYAIGCMMGRYSLDQEGLVYAHAANKDFDASQYSSFPADDDGIIPITDYDWFSDDACNRLVQFIETAWPKEKRDENLLFLAEGLGKKAGDKPVDALRRYLSRDFFKDHLKTYKKRPIYWLFSSGKHKAFECLVYLHRYNEGTLSRMRQEYVQKLLGRYESRIKMLQDNIASASSTSARKKMEKELTQRQNQQLELRKYDEQLRHFTDQRIALDLDDGVKVNYGKFGTLLANVKDVTGVKG